MEWSMFRGRPLMFILAFCIGLVLVCVVFGSRRSSEYTNDTVKISSLLSASIHLTKLAGSKVVSVRRNNDPEIQAKVKGHTVEGAKEYVTLGDQKSNHLIVGGLLAQWPSLKLRSEEVGMAMDPVIFPLLNKQVAKVIERDEEVDMDDVTIWIDPLDATQEYTEGGEQPDLLQYVTVMICIVVGKYPVAGVIHQPFVKDDNGEEGVTHWGWVGHGVSKSLRQPPPKGNDDVRVVFSRSHAGTIGDLINNTYKDKPDKVRKMIAAGSGYKTIQVVQNKADAYLHTTKIKKWDTCAGNAIVNAFGGAMTTIKGKDIDYSYKSEPAIFDGLIATTDDHQYKDLLERIKKTSKA